MAETTPTQHNPNQLDKHELNRGFKVIRSMAGIAILTAGAVWFGSNSMKSNRVAENIKPTPAEAPANPGVQPDTPVVEEPTGLRLSEQASPEQAMQKYDNMDVNAFDLLPQSDRVPYTQYLANLPDNEEAYNWLYGTLFGNEAYKIEKIQASPNNTADEIVKINQRNTQMAYLQSIEHGRVNFDHAAGQKMLSLVFDIVGTEQNKRVSNGYLDSVENEKSKKKITALTDSYTVTGSGKLSTGTDSEGQSVKYMDITKVNGKGKTIHTRYVYREFSDQGAWLIDSNADTASDLAAEAFTK